MFYWWFLVVVFSSCTLPNKESLQKKGESIQKSLVEDLKEVSCKEELIEKIPNLKKNFIKMAKLTAEVSLFLVEHPSENSPYNPKTGEELYRELLRIYEIPGGKEILERIQKEAILYLPKEPLVELELQQEA